MKIHGLLALSLFTVASPSLADADPCKPIAGLEPLLRPGTLLLLGEIHGTAESPAFALDVACHAVHAGLPVIVGLEIASGEQGRVDRYLSSQGTDEDRNALLAGEPWRRDYQDGRSSRAMLALIDGVRRLRSGDTPARVALFDAGGAGGGQQRERGMAANLVRVLGESPGAMTIVLTGNLHSRVVPGRGGSRAYEPMGYLIERAGVAERVIALDVAHDGGSAWICAPDCGVSRLAGKRGEPAWSVEIDDATRPAGHAGWYHVGAVTASPPAHPSHRVEEHAPAPRASPSRAGEAPVESPTRPAADDAPTARDAPAAEEAPPARLADPRFEGGWQAHDFSSHQETWAMRFHGSEFRAEGGPDDWYEGTITVRPETSPKQIDFRIRDCMCSYKGMTSEGIYYWDGESIVVFAPRPGEPRPPAFVEASGGMMRLERPAGP